jgi:uncharacterized protein YfdQ (DUF2303 family)
VQHRAAAILDAPADFVHYVGRLEDESTTVWAWQAALTVTAVFNDHTSEVPGWRDHVAYLRVERDPDWAKWRKLDGALIDQVQFAEHIEDQTHVIVDPDAATMLEVANSFHAHRSSTFSQKIKVESGDIQLAWTDETTASAGSGRVDVPRRFVLSLAPFVGVAPIEVHARCATASRRADWGWVSGCCTPRTSNEKRSSTSPPRSATA